MYSYHVHGEDAVSNWLQFSYPFFKKCTTLFGFLFLFWFVLLQFMWLQPESSSFKNGFLKYLIKGKFSPFPYGPVCSQLISICSPFFPVMCFLPDTLSISTSGTELHFLGCWERSTRVIHLLLHILLPNGDKKSVLLGKWILTLKNTCQFSASNGCFSFLAPCWHMENRF